MSYDPVTGGYNWRQEVVGIIQSQKANIEALRTLLRYAKTPETSVIIGELIADGAQQIDRLHTMLQVYRDRKDG